MSKRQNLLDHELYNKIFIIEGHDVVLMDTARAIAWLEPEIVQSSTVVFYTTDGSVVQRVLPALSRGGDKYIGFVPVQVEGQQEARAELIGILRDWFAQHAADIPVSRMGNELLSHSLVYFRSRV